LEEVIISNEPTDKIIDLTLTVPGEINGYQFGLEYRAFQNLNSRNIRLHLRFEERNGKKVLISDGSDMFSNSSAIYSFDFSGIDTSRMHRMCAMFAGCTNITSLDLSHFDTDELFYNYGNFKGAFYNCPKLKNLDISSFRKGQSTDDMMVIMFQDPDKNISLGELKRRIDIWQCSRFLGDKGAHYIDVNRYKKNSIHDFRSELNQISWSRACSARECDIKLNNIEKYKWILDNFYEESRTKVIGKAIGDCVAEKGAFANKTSKDIIIFEKTDPKNYKPENWNAVILYNYVHEVINGEYPYPLDDVSVALVDKLDGIKKFYKNHYHIENDKLDRAIKNAVNDIQQYVKALNLSKTLLGFIDNKSQYDKYKLPAKLAYGVSPDFDESGGGLLQKFYYTDTKDAANKRLCYTPKFRYHNRKLYISELDIATESFIQETKKWKTDSYLVSITERSEFSKIQDESTKPEFRWLTDRLKGLVEMPGEELWNKWRKEYEEENNKSEEYEEESDEKED